jgi:glycosyltransferase involved in cell wall biosynthesis
MRDVTVSVWNRFHSFPLVEGLTLAGFDVLGLGTTRRRPRCREYHCCWSSALLTQASYQFPKFQERLLEAALDRYENFARTRALDARCFWGWSNHHRAAVEEAKNAAIPIIVETGSTHARWAERALSAEYADQSDLDYAVITPRRMANMLAEYELADAICVPSSFVARTFVQEGVPEKKIHVNPFGVDVDFWRHPVPLKNGEQNRAFVFVYCGQIMRRKGFHYLVQAWREARLTNSELWLVGVPETACQGLISELPRGVRYFGRKSHEKLREIYAGADAYILPSLEEGLARSILEAMAAGLPVIVTEATGATDIMVDGEDGWVVRAGDAASLAAAMRHAAEDPESTKRRGISAASRVQPFTWDAYGQRAAAFLQSFLENR